MLLSVLITMSLSAKYTCLFASALILTVNMFAQQSINVDLNVKSTENIPTTKISKGQEFQINFVSCDMSSSKGYNYILGITTQEGENISINLRKARKMPISYDVNSKDDYWNARTIKETLPMLSTMSNVYSLRTKAETTAYQYVSELRSNALTIEEPFLTSYINSLLVKINPSERLDFFKYNVRNLGQSGLLERAYFSDSQTE